MENTWLDKFNLLIFDEIDSTNFEAYRLINRGISDNYIITAKSQTEGRGRYGRTWYSPKGNLYLSLLIRTNLSLDYLSQFTFLSSLSILETLFEITGNDTNIKLKWPNDILMNNKKISGILLESVTDFYNKKWLIIGIGVNLKHYPKDSRYAATSLFKETKSSIEPTIFLDKLIKHFQTNNINLSSIGFSDIRKKWLRNAWNLGKTFHYKNKQNDISGIFKTIGKNGEFILEDSKGKLHKINSGEVFCE